MSQSQPFSLIRFQPGGQAPATPLSLSGKLSLSGELNIGADALEISYRISGDLRSLAIPAASGDPQRRDGLWQSTCLELFLASGSASDYWEFNLSPAGHWNVYHLDAYRQGLRQEEAYKDLPFAVTRSQQHVTLSLGCALPPGLRARASCGLEANITAVIAHTDGSIDYWALHHPGTEADFHHRDGFQLRF